MNSGCPPKEAPKRPINLTEREANMERTVKAAVLEEPGKMNIREFPYPKLGKGAAIGRMVMAGICGTDKHSYKGESVQYKGTKNEIDIPYPIIQGHENVFVIEEIDELGSRTLDFDGNILKPGRQSHDVPGCCVRDMLVL